MSDRPIMFSAPMVRALLAGHKTQTRRLATSPLAACNRGDRLWVREAWRTSRVADELKPRQLTGLGPVWYEADRDNCDRHGRLRASMHMPRWASRLTLGVELVGIEPLQALDEACALAEGVRPLPGDGPNRFTVDVQGWGISAPTAVETYRLLWQWLNGPESWDANPAVLVLAFSVRLANINLLDRSAR